MRFTRRRLNRATLARQALLGRETIGVVEAVERFGGLQAQEPATPYIALWARVRDLDAEVVSTAIADRLLVKAALHRSTLHLVSAGDYLGAIAAISLVTRTKWMNVERGRPVHRDLTDLTEEALAFATEPRTNAEMRAFAGSLGEPVPDDEIWRRIRRHGSFIAVPDASPWAFGRRPIHVAARSWLAGQPLDETASLAHIVRRYLRAFGPARLADVAQWSGVGTRRLEEGAALIDDLEQHEDEDGRAILDLSDAPRPEADSEAPPRLLPMWDETLLAYKDRSRILPDAYRKVVIAPNGDVAPTILVDGEVAGRWWAEARDGLQSPRIVLEPFVPLPPAVTGALEAEGDRLAAFIAEREPAVYRRYRR